MLSECIDSVELQTLAAANARRQLRVDAARLAKRFKRLAEILAARAVSEDSASSIGVDLHFENGAEGYPRVGIQLAGQIELECQRCLRPFGFAIDLESRLTILRSDDQSTEIADPFDAVVMTPEGLDMLTVIEDEILSALPIAPIHESVADCAALNGKLPELINQPGKLNRPFANLSALMDQGAKDRVD
jgi:uncharacterized protein